MNRNVIRGALDMLRDVDVLNPERCAQVIDEAVRTVQAELDKEPEVLTDDAIDRIAMNSCARPCGDGDVTWDKDEVSQCISALRYARDHYGIGAPAERKSLTEEQCRFLADCIAGEALEHRKFGHDLHDVRWAELAARKAVSHLSDFGYLAPAAVASDERPWMNEWQRNMSKKSKGLLIRMIEEERAECDRLRNEAPAAGLTEEEIVRIAGDWFNHVQLNMKAGDDSASDLRARLTAAIEQKNRKP